MVFKYHKTSYLALSLIMSSFAYCQEQIIVPQESAPKQSTALDEKLLEGYLQQADSLLLELKTLLSQIALKVTNLKADLISDKKTAHAFVRTWNIALDTLRNETLKTYFHADEEEKLRALLQLIKTCTLCSQDISTAMQSNFAQMNHSTLPQDKTLLVTTEALEDAMISFAKELKTLGDQSLWIGITMKNRCVRAVDNVLTWCGKYHIGSITTFLTGCGAFGLYLGWHHLVPTSQIYTRILEADKDEHGNHVTDENGNLVFDPNNVSFQPPHKFDPATIASNAHPALKLSFASPDDIIAHNGTSTWRDFFATKLYHWFGAPIALSPNGQYSVQAGEETKANRIDYFICNFMRNKMTPVAQWGAGTLFGATSYFMSQKILPSFKKAISSKWNTLKGGSYLNRHVNDMFEFFPDTNFDNIIGMEEYKDQFKLLLDYCLDPEHKAQSGNNPDRGYQFTGPTRTGKTFLAYALCGEIERMCQDHGSNVKFRFFSIPGAVACSNRVSDIIAYAQRAAPCVIFIDEFDLCGTQRSNPQFLADALTTLGNANNKIDPKKPIITIVATNKPELIDKALGQPGRLGTEVRFEYPCLIDRMRFIEHKLAQSALDPSQFNIERLAEKIADKSFEDMSRFINSARSRAFIENKPVTQLSLERSIDEVLRHIIFSDNKRLPESELLLLAAHFSGKAVAMTLLQDETMVLDMVTINSYMPTIREERNNGTGNESWQQKILVGDLFTRKPLDSIGLKMRPQIINRIMYLVAGSVAEEIILGHPSANSCHPWSISEAFNLAQRLCYAGIWKGQIQGNALHDKLCQEAYDLITECKNNVRELLEQHKDQLEAVLCALIQGRVLSDQEIYYLMDHASEFLEEIKKNISEFATNATE